MIVHIFNSSIVSGPERLVLPALSTVKKCELKIFFLTETRCLPEALQPLEYAKSLGLSFESIDVSGRLDFYCISKLASRLKENNVRIAHAHDVKASTYLLAAKWLGGLSELKLISTHHGVRARPGWKLRIFEKFYVTCVLPYFQRSLAVCSSDKALLLSRGLKRDRVFVHLNGIRGVYLDVSRRSEQRIMIHRRWGLDGRGVSQDAQLIGLVGRLEQEKCVERALRIFSILINACLVNSCKPEPHLVVFGTGSLQDELKALSVRLGIEGRVHWMNYRANLAEDMAGFDLLFMVSEAEGLPIAALEAAWSGTPVVAPAIDGFLDLFGDFQEEGLFFADADDFQVAEVIRGLLLDSARRQRLAIALQQRVKQHFSQERWLSELFSVYEELG